jgi:hypothetical protein
MPLIGQKKISGRSDELEDEHMHGPPGGELKFCHAVSVHQAYSIDPSTGQMFFQEKKETRGDAGAGGFTGNKVDAGKSALQRQKKDIILLLLMKDEEKIMIGPLDHFIHPRSGQDGGKFINDLFKDIKIQSAFLSERRVLGNPSRHPRMLLSGIRQVA